jgi:uncharacterized repeat protein (TIGR01451 family)
MIMKNFIPNLKANNKKALCLALLLPLMLVMLINVTAQVRSYGLIHSENIRGGATIFGNTLMNLVNSDGTANVIAMNDNAIDGNSSYSNGSSNGSAIMQYVDVDGTTGDGAGTKNSSSSDLVLPAGNNTIKTARLYWGGRAYTAAINMSLPANRTIKIRKGTSGPYIELLALQVDRIYQNTGTANEVTFYQAYVDVTSFIQQNGPGTYTVGNAALTAGNGGTFGNYGAWGIEVVYENPALDFNSIRVYDGFRQVFNGGNPFTTTITLTGLDVPMGVVNSEDARMSVLTWEGDANFKQDYLEINGNKFSNVVNPINNPWNGTITNDGIHVTTKNPNYTNQMGIDIDQFNVGTGYGILPNANSVTLKFGTELDSYFPGVFAFVIRMKDPSISLTKTVTDADNSNTAEPGEVLTYTLKGKNLGLSNALFVSVADTLPNTVTYVANSIKVNYSPGVASGSLTDAIADDNGEFTTNGVVNTIQLRLGTGSNTVTGGTLASLDSFEVEFQVTVNIPPSGESIPPIINIARLSAQSESMVPFVDDAIAIINPTGGPLPVTLKSFAASLIGNSLVKINWITSMEINSENYVIERSSDGRFFTTIATIDGAGNTSTERSYTINDNVSAVNAPFIYYRLKQVDFDGKASYSKVVSVRLKKGIIDFTVAPNPFHSYVNINIDWAKNENTTVSVFNMTGREVVSKDIKMIKGTNYVEVHELSALPAGNYILQFNNGEKKIFKQIIKQ